MTEAENRLPTGFPALDRALGGGWPPAVLIELLVDTPGIGELSLLLPALTGLSAEDGNQKQGRKFMLVGAPYIPYAPALKARGIRLEDLLVCDAQRRDDVLWATEQALDSGACSAVLVWSDVSGIQSLRRLQLAAERGSSRAILFRSSRFRRQRSPAAVRICLSAGDTGVLDLDIFKHRGGRPVTVSADVGG